MTRLGAAALMLFAPLLAGCAANAPPNSNRGYDQVALSFDYTPATKDARAWRTFLTALDRCHTDGYRDAQLAGPPKTICAETAPDGACGLYRTAIAYDCVGLGYQTF